MERAGDRFELLLPTKTYCQKSLKGGWTLLIRGVFSKSQIDSRIFLRRIMGLF
jgi:hypothetical protein